MRHVHFLHINKTGGTAIAAALSACSDVTIHKHRTKLRDIPAGEPAFFSVRHPFARFVSGFNSRLRKGYPHHFADWSRGEHEAFGRFATANDLAEGLGGERRSEALAAMKSIRNVNSFLTDWLDRDELAEREADIVFVCRQENLSEDFERLKTRLALPHACRLPTDPAVAHRTPAGFDQALSELANSNLKVWFAPDLRLLDDILDLRRRILQAGAARVPPAQTATDRGSA